MPLCFDQKLWQRSVVLLPLEEEEVLVVAVEDSSAGFNGMTERGLAICLIYFGLCLYYNRSIDPFLCFRFDDS